MDIIDNCVNRLKAITGGKRWWVAFLVLVVFFSGIRFFRINADPAPDLSISAALYTDEGFKAYSSRNYHYHGDWKWTPRDNYQSWYQKSPVPAYLYRLWFRLFGVSFASIRSMNIVFGVATMILLFFMVRRFYDIHTAFVGMILFGTNHFLVMYNRLGFYENLQMFFTLAAFYALAEVFSRRARLKEALQGGTVQLTQQLWIMIVAAAAGTVATIAGILTKQSVSIVALAVLPFFTLYFFYSHQRLNRLLIRKFYATIILIVSAYLIVAHFSWLESSVKGLLTKKIFNVQLNYILPLQQGSQNFDPIYMTFIKSLYLEFVYLQPVVFFCGLFFGFFTYYRFLYQQKFEAMDLALSTWFLFGYLFLAVMQYHPSRYYMLIIAPLIILAARFVTSQEYSAKAEMLQHRQFRSFRRVMLIIFWFYFIYYTGLSIIVNGIPFSIRKKIYNHVYFNIEKNNPDALIPVLVGILVFIVLIFVLLVPLIGTLEQQVKKKHFYARVFALILLFDMALFAKWAITSENRLYNLSRKIGRILPRDAIITGCWASGVSLENRLRALVIQTDMNYNRDVAVSVQKGEWLKVSRIRKGKTVSLRESGMPLYLLVGRNAPFDKTIMTYFRRYITPDRLVLKEELGLYDVEMYRLTGPSAEKK